MFLFLVGSLVHQTDGENLLHLGLDVLEIHLDLVDVRPDLTSVTTTEIVIAVTLRERIGLNRWRFKAYFNIYCFSLNSNHLLLSNWSEEWMP